MNANSQETTVFCAHTMGKSTHTTGKSKWLQLEAQSLEEKAKCTRLWNEDIIEKLKYQVLDLGS